MMSVFRAVATAVVGCALMGLPAYAGGESAATAATDGADVRADLRAQLQQIQSFQAQFTQRVTDADGRLVEEGSGEFLLARPDRFRWEYAEPFPRLLLADGERIWLYDIELEQVTVRSMTGLLEKTPAALLAGDPEQLDNYDVRGERDGSILAVQLLPRAARSDFRQIDIAFVAGALTRLELRDQFGQLTRIDFAETQQNPDIALESFEFAVPAGVDVIDETD